MGLGAPWAGTYLEPQQKEQSSVIFINQSPTIHQNFPGINPMGLGAPWANAYLEQKKETIFCNVYKSIANNPSIIFQESTQWDLVILDNNWADSYLEPQQNEKAPVIFINQSPTIHQKLSNLRNCLE